MSWLRDLPLKRKLTLVILISTGAMLLLASFALAGFQLFDARRTLVRDATVLADVLAKNTRAALSFQDEASARETLQALQSEPLVSGACLYAADGSRFASYARDSGSILPEHAGPEGSRFEGGSLVILRPVRLEEKRIGTLYVRADLTGVYDRLKLFAGIATLVLLGSLVVALAFATRLQRPISQPILDLAGLARTVAEHKDYSVRASIPGRDEIGILAGAFNQMLGRISEREKALRQEIIERQAAETRAQAQLARLELLDKITRAIGERQDLESIFYVVTANLEERLPIDFGCVCLSGQPGMLSIAAVGPASRAAADALGLGPRAQLAVSENGLARCLEQGRLVYEPDTAQVPSPFPERLARAGLRSLVIAPLLVESQVFGLILSARRATEAFSSGECEFLKQLSEHVALAVNQKQVYGALQQAYEDLRHTQQAVMQHERLRALGQMASGIAHDINNAISPVMVYTDLLLSNEPNLSQKARASLETMQHAIEDVAATVSRMREFYREREPQLSLMSVPLNRLVTQVIDLSRARWSDIPLQKGVQITMATELDPKLPPIMGVESEIREALVNLIFNAVDAMPEGGTLTLRTRVLEPEPEPGGRASRRICVEVSDTGVGMDEDTRRRCLEPFFTTKGERGTGLGLAMVYGVVQRHSAEIEIDSAPGQGTTMRLLFGEPTGPVMIAPVTAEAAPSSRLRLLVIDDDPLLIKSLRDALEADGHLVTAILGGQAGLDTFREAAKGKEPFAAVITDLGMPHVDGRKVANTVKEISPKTPVILLTGWGRRLISEGEVPPNVDFVLSKPPKVRDLRDALARCVGKK